MIRPIQDLYNQYKDDICVVVPFGGMNHISNAIDNIVHRHDGRIIVIDSASEGNLASQAFRDIHDKCDDSEIDCGKVLLIQSNYNLEKQYEEFCRKNNIRTKINLCVTEHKLESSVESFNFIKNETWNFHEYDKRPNLNKWSDMGRGREYYFISYNKTLRPDRVALLSLLYKEDLIKKGLVSIGSEEYGSTGKQEWPNEFNFINNNLELINKWSDELRKLQPLNVDGEPGVDTLDEGKNKGVNVCGYTYGDQFQRVYFMMLTEDVFNSESMFFSQTTYKPIVCLTPFIMFGSPYMIRNFVEVQGFKSFSPWIDESYDLEENHEKRLFMIVEEMKRLCGMSIEEMDEWYFEMKEILIHNQKHLLNYPLDDYDIVKNKIEYLLSC